MSVAVFEKAATLLFDAVKLIFAAGTCKFNCVAFEVNVAFPGDTELTFTATLLFKSTLNEPKYANDATPTIHSKNILAKTSINFVSLDFSIILLHPL